MIIAYGTIRRPEVALLLLPYVLGAQNETAPPTFSSEVRLVEVYATVIDSKGRFVDDLVRENFEVQDSGKPVPIVVFETGASALSCALLLDTTGSMQQALPFVKNAAFRLMDQLRANDSVAVFSFSGSMTLVADFNTDKAAAKRTILRTQARGNTALFDGIAQTVERLSRRSGRKALIVFTDGKDNASVLSASTSFARARRAGIPVFAIAQGEALTDRRLFNELASLSRSTGGRTWGARKLEDVQQIFDAIAGHLRHVYLLAYVAPPFSGPDWRPIHVQVRGEKLKVGAREGYFPD